MRLLMSLGTAGGCVNANRMSRMRHKQCTPVFCCCAGGGFLGGKKGIIAAHSCFAASMSLLLRPRNLFVLLSYLLLSCTPFVARLFGHPVAHPGTVLGIELICWTGVWALFKRPAYFHWLLLPGFLALPVELYLYAFYGQGISTHHLGIIVATSPAEAIEFLGRKVWLLIGVSIG